LHILHGTFRKDRHGALGEQVQFPATRPTCPAWLGKEAKAEWKRQVKALEAAGILASVDRALLAVWCDAWADFAQAATLIAQHGPLVKRANGDLARSPVARLRDSAAQRLLAVAVQFGFTPVARARIKVDAPQVQQTGIQARQRS
jgi:P27 family predicted phage terminase small subunit